MTRSFDPEVFRKAVEPYPDIFRRTDFPFEEWLNSRNVMFEEDGSIGLFSFEYPGYYTGHWFFKVRGKEAQNLASRMLDEMFKNGMQICRGLTEVSLKHAIYAARKLGFKSHGIVPGGIYFEDKEYELSILTKEDFYKEDK